MNPLARFCVLAVVSIGLLSCSTTSFEAGRDYDVDAFATKVVRGTTTKDQVRSWLGDPKGTGVSVETTGERYEEWTYYFARGALTNLASTSLKTLRIKFDQQGLVQGFDYSR